jgi:hypothetical protein
MVGATGITSNIEHKAKYTDLSSAMRLVPLSEDLPPNPQEKLTFSNDNSDSDDDHGQQERENVYCNPTFAAVSFTYKPHLLTQRYLMALTVILICLKLCTYLTKVICPIITTIYFMAILIDRYNDRLLP